MLAAIRVFGRTVLAAGDDSTIQPNRQAVGRQLLHLVFGTQDAGQQLPPVAAGVLADPDSERAATALIGQAHQAFDTHPAMASAAAVLIADFYRRQADGGNLQALVDLGHFLYWDEPEAARAAYQEAVGAGHLHALIDLAKVLRNVLDDEDASLEVYEQALSSGDADVATEAMYELACVHVLHRDAAAARAMFQQVIDTRHPEWAAAAMVGLANMLLRLDESDAAEALYREAIQAGNTDWSTHASCLLGDLLEGKGDVAGAKAAWQRVIDSRNPEWAGTAFISLVNLLENQGDVDGLRSAYLTGAALNNPDALYALLQLGQLLESQGDIDGAHEAWQQAIDAGCEDADYWRERMSPPPERRSEASPYPPDLPPEFNPRNMVRAGIDVLEHGLPPLPEVLTYQMAIPVAYWKAEQCAVVLILQFGNHGRDEPEPMALQVTYSRAEDGSWQPPTHSLGTSFSHDPIANPGSQRDLDGRPMAYGGTSKASQVAPGHPAFIATGRAVPEVKYLALTQDGREDRRPLESHFGAWVVCTEQPGPFELAGIDENGSVLASLRLPFRPPKW